MTRWIFLMALALAAAALVAGCGQKEEQAQVKETAQGAQVASAKVVDPVCGMSIDAQAAVTTEHEGETYYFCSTNCKEQFMQDPAKYMSAEEHHMEGESHGEHGS